MAGEKQSILNMLESQDPTDNKLAINLLYYDGVAFQNLNILATVLKKTIKNIKDKSGGEKVFGRPANESPEEIKEKKELFRMARVIYARHATPGYRSREKKANARQKRGVSGILQDDAK